METTVRTKASRGKGTPAADGAAEAVLAPELLRKMDAYWRAANYLSVGQI
jgi:xylulose-5-phosphate/fructose-6-phosphate phosphoketolase